MFSSIPISGVIIAFQEEARIKDAVAALLPFCVEVLVVDSHSTDRTCELAEQAGARVLSRSFTTHQDQKNWAVSQAHHDWVFSLDADEQLEETLPEELAEFDFSNLGLIGRLPRRNFYLEDWIDHTGWRRDSSARLFNRKRAVFGGSAVHDSVEGKDCREQRFTSRILHWPYRNLEHHLGKINSYTTALALEEISSTRPLSKGKLLFKMLFDPPWKFLKMFILQGGFRMGWRGFVVSLMAAIYVFMKYAKSWEARLGKGTA
jgi:glycosyltransferase involved in cell wall biosynthesis